MVINAQIGKKKVEMQDASMYEQESVTKRNICLYIVDCDISINTVVPFSSVQLVIHIDNKMLVTP
jgi:hypothetical protein